MGGGEEGRTRLWGEEEGGRDGGRAAAEIGATLLVEDKEGTCTMYTEVHVHVYVLCTLRYIYYVQVHTVPTRRWMYNLQSTQKYQYFIHSTQS